MNSALTCGHASALQRSCSIARRTRLMRSQRSRGPGQSRSRDFATPYPAHIFIPDAPGTDSGGCAPWHGRSMIDGQSPSTAPTSQTLGDCHAREETQEEDRAQTRRLQEEAEEAPRSRHRLKVGRSGENSYPYGSPSAAPAFLNASHAARCVACHGVGSHAEAVALVIECSIAVV